MSVLQSPAAPSELLRESNGRVGVFFAPFFAPMDLCLFEVCSEDLSFLHISEELFVLSVLGIPPTSFFGDFAVSCSPVLLVTSPLSFRTLQL